MSGRSWAELRAITGVVRERRSPSNGVEVNGISSVSAVALVPSALVEDTELDTALVVVNLHIGSEEVAGSARVSRRQGVTRSLAALVVHVTIREALVGEIRILAIGAGTRG